MTRSGAAWLAAIPFLAVVVFLGWRAGTPGSVTVISAGSTPPPVIVNVVITPPAQPTGPVQMVLLIPTDEPPMPTPNVKPTKEAEPVCPGAPGRGCRWANPTATPFPTPPVCETPVANQWCLMPTETPMPTRMPTATARTVPTETRGGPR